MPAHRAGVLGGAAVRRARGWALTLTLYAGSSDRPRAWGWGRAGEPARGTCWGGWAGERLDYSNHKVQAHPSAPPFPRLIPPAQDLPAWGPRGRMRAGLGGGLDYGVSSPALFMAPRPPPTEP